MREPGAANGDTAAAAAETIGEEDLAADELRPLAENLGFNLTSVLANPRETDSIFDFDPYLLLTEGFFSSEEGDQFDPSKLPPPPIPLPNITFESLAPFMDRTGDLQVRYHAMQRATARLNGREPKHRDRQLVEADAIAFAATLATLRLADTFTGTVVLALPPPPQPLPPPIDSDRPPPTTVGPVHAQPWRWRREPRRE